MAIVINNLSTIYLNVVGHPGSTTLGVRLLEGHEGCINVNTIISSRPISNEEIDAGNPTRRGK
jgi:hypothetical protein